MELNYSQKFFKTNVLHLKNFLVSIGYKPKNTKERKFVKTFLVDNRFIPTIRVLFIFAEYVNLPVNYVFCLLFTNNFEKELKRISKEVKNELLSSNA